MITKTELLMLLSLIWVMCLGVALLLLFIGCCERDILGDCIHRSAGSTNSLSPSELDTLCNGTDEQAQKIIQRHNHDIQAN